MCGGKYLGAMGPGPVPPRRRFRDLRYDRLPAVIRPGRSRAASSEPRKCPFRLASGRAGESRARHREPVSHPFDFQCIRISSTDCRIARLPVRSRRRPRSALYVAQDSGGARTGTRDGVVLPAARCSSVRGHPDAMPVASDSIDIVILPHIIEFEKDPYAILRESERVLVPEGHLVVAGYNALGLMGAWNLLRRHGAPGTDTSTRHRGSGTGSRLSASTPSRTRAASSAPRCRAPGYFAASRYSRASGRSSGPACAEPGFWWRASAPPP